MQGRPDRMQRFAQQDTTEMNVEIHSKTIKNPPEMGKKSTQNCSWEAVGASGEALGAAGGIPGGRLDRFGAILAPSWDLLGATWRPPWDHLRDLWSLSGALEALGRLFGRSWEPFGRPKGSKRYPKGTQNGPRRHQKSLSKRIPRSTALYMQFPINFQ